MLIGNVVTKLDVPHEPGEWVEVRKLNHRTLAKAASVRSEAGIQSMRTLGADLLTALRQARDEVKEGLAAPTADVYDRDLVLQGGVVRWSYATPVTSDTLGDLDDVTARWLATEIIARSVAPPSAESVGNATSPSTGS